MNSQHKIKREVEAAKVLKSHLAELLGDDLDSETIRDSVEGETELHEAIAEAAMQVFEDKLQAEALKAMITKLQERMNRYKHREEMTRTAILNAMAVAEISEKMEFPFATISRGKKPRALVITDESSIPADYWKPADPKLDKKALGDALKTGSEVSGAELDNGGETLIIRFA